jgi:hypothetical protein
LFKQGSTSDLGSRSFDYVERGDDSRWLEYGVARHPSETSRCPFGPQILLTLVAYFSLDISFSAPKSVFCYVSSPLFGGEAAPGYRL